MNIYEHIRQARIYSYIMTAIAVYWLSGCLDWLYAMNMDTLSTQAVALATGVLTALLAMLKMIFTLATYKAPKD